MSEDLLRELKAAIEAKENIAIIHHGGRQPGSWRLVVPLEIRDGMLVAIERASGRKKGYRVDQVEIYDPMDDVPRKEGKAPREVFGTVEDD